LSSGCKRLIKPASNRKRSAGEAGRFWGYYREESQQPLPASLIEIEDRPGQAGLVVGDHRARHHRRFDALGQVRNFSCHSVDDLARKLSLDPGNARYHAEVLARWRTVKRSEGPAGPQVESLATERPEVIALLESTESEDEC
jgi:hypothetical protein